MTCVFSKDPDAELPYTIDWSSWLDAGDTIATSAWVVPSPLTKLAESNTTTVAVVKIGGGVAGAEYAIVNSIVTTNGLKDDRTIVLYVEDR